MSELNQYDYRVVVTSGGFGLYYIEEDILPSGFYGSWVLCGSVTVGDVPWSPPAGIIGGNNGAGAGAYSINGVLYTFVVVLSPSSLIPGSTPIVVVPFTTTNTGISVVEETTYSLASNGDGYYIITSANGRVWTSTDFSTWTEVTGSFIPAPASAVITQADINNANSNAPPGLTFVFGAPSLLTEGGVNSHTGPPFAMQQKGGAIEYNVPNNNISTRGGAIELTASITGPLPPAVGQGGTREQTGLPVRQEG